MSDYDEIVRLAALRDRGYLSDEEFEAQKENILRSKGRVGGPSVTPKPAVSSSRPPRMTHPLLIASIIVGALLVLVVGSGAALIALRGHSKSSRTASTNENTPISVVTSATATTTLASSAVVSVALQVVACPTSFAVGGEQSITPPPSMVVALPNDLKGQVAVYADEANVMELIGPKGWSCNAGYGANGSGGVTIYEPSEGPPDYQSTQPTEEAIQGAVTACLSCRESQACPLFGAAAADYQRDQGSPCPSSRPSSESVDQLSPGVVAFQDPPGVKGDGSPSGGDYSANGVMTYYADSPSWLETCTLPYSQHALCTAVLNTFVSWYGSK